MRIYSVIAHIHSIEVQARMYKRINRLKRCINHSVSFRTVYGNGASMMTNNAQHDVNCSDICMYGRYGMALFFDIRDIVQFSTSRTATPSYALHTSTFCPSPMCAMFLLRTLRCEPELLEKDLSGHVYLVTGANSGIGLATSAQLYKQGAHVVLACRRTEAGEQAMKTFTGKGTAEVLKLDLADLSSVREAARTFLAKHDRLDGLVNNAGVVNNSYKESKDGFEMMFAVNHLGHFLLTELLIDVLKKSVPSRIVCLSSATHAGSSKERHTVDLDDLKWEKRGYAFLKAYAQSKLANVLHARELAKRLHGRGVTAVSGSPGWVCSNLVASVMPIWIQNIIMVPFYPLLSILSCEDGAQTSLHCILDDDVPKHNGEYYSQSSIFYAESECRPGGFPMKSPNPNAHNDELARNLYERSKKMVGLG